MLVLPKKHTMFIQIFEFFDTPCKHLLSVTVISKN
nr:MAG TPA: hypothetical protein [Bacteriophage sp.]